MTKNEGYKVTKWLYLCGTGVDPNSDQAEYWANRMVKTETAIDELGSAMYEETKKRIANASSGTQDSKDLKKIKEGLGLL